LIIMKVTDIIPGRKKLSTLYLDGQPAAVLDTNALFENGITIGSELDDDEYAELVDKCEYSRAKEKALFLLGIKDYSKKQLFDKLQKEVSAETSESVCERMEELGLINDENYARRLAHDLLYIKKLSERGALYKLMEKGISRDVCESVLDEFEVDPTEQIVQLIEKKYKNKLQDEKDRRRTVAALQRMGYSWSDIKDALESFLE